MSFSLIFLDIKIYLKATTTTKKAARVGEKQQKEL